MLKNLLMTGLLALAADLPAAQHYPPVTVDMPVRQVSEHAYYALGSAGIATDNEGFITNAGFVATDGGVVVFDSLGSPSLAWKLRQKIREITDQPVVKVVVSHYHADHIHGLQVFEDEGAEILAPRGAYEAADWSRFERLPAFEAANRRNAYQVYLSLEAELQGQ